MTRSTKAEQIYHLKIELDIARETITKLEDRLAAALEERQDAIDKLTNALKYSQAQAAQYCRNAMQLEQQLQELKSKHVQLNAIAKAILDLASRSAELTPFIQTIELSKPAGGYDGKSHTHQSIDR